MRQPTSLKGLVRYVHEHEAQLGFKPSAVVMKREHAYLMGFGIGPGEQERWERAVDGMKAKVMGVVIVIEENV